MLLIYTYMNLITNTNTLFAKDDCLCLSSLAAKVSNVFSHLSKVQSFYFILKVVIFSLKTLLMLGGADLGERYDSVNSTLKGLLFWTEWPISLFDAWCFEFKGFAILRWVLTILEKDRSVQSILSKQAFTQWNNIYRHWCMESISCTTSLQFSRFQVSSLFWGYKKISARRAPIRSPSVVD